MGPTAIETEFTPNPHSLKFNVPETLLAAGSAYFAAKEEAAHSPLAKKLLVIPHVTAVLIGRNFVTLSRDPSLETWAAIVPPATRVLREHCASGAPAVGPGYEPSGKAPAGTEIEKRIRQVLDERVRPAVARDGGDIIFRGFKDGVVTLHLQGACSSCPSSVMTLKAGVERMLHEFVPEIKEVVQV